MTYELKNGQLFSVDKATYSHIASILVYLSKVDRSRGLRNLSVKTAMVVKLLEGKVKTQVELEYGRMIALGVAKVQYQNMQVSIEDMIRAVEEGRVVGDAIGQVLNEAMRLRQKALDIDANKFAEVQPWLKTKNK